MEQGPIPPNGAPAPPAPPAPNGSNGAPPKKQGGRQKKGPSKATGAPPKRLAMGGPPPRAATLAPPPSTCRACQGAHSAHTCGKTRKRRKVAQPPLEPPRVVVIGAGVAGIGCARTLEQLGAVVTVVEAKPRVGGRCASTKINDEGAAVVEL